MLEDNTSPYLPGDVPVMALRGIPAHGKVIPCEREGFNEFLMNTHRGIFITHACDVMGSSAVTMNGMGNRI